jgi:hypothetical protein
VAVKSEHFDDWSVITLKDWALIRRLAAEGVPKAQIAKRLGISRTTVVKAVGSDSPPKYERAPQSTSFAMFEGRVRIWLADDAEMPASVIAERVGWTGSARWFRENVAKLRPEHRRVDPADRLTWEAGDAAQCDLWFPPRKIPLEDGTDDSDADHGGSAAGLVGVDPATRAGPAPADLGQRGRHRPPRQTRRRVTAFAGTLATRIVQLKPYDPESKGIVERRNGFFETSFMPGRTFVSPADFNA